MLFQRTFCPPPAGTMAGEVAFWGKSAPGRGGRVCNPADPLRRFNSAAPDRKVLLAVCEATSNAALTGVSDLKAALEVA